MSHDEHTQQKPGSGKKQEPIPHDQIWKTLFGQFLQDLVEIVDPDLAATLDLSAPTFLRDESFTDQPRGRRVVADLVAEARTRDGKSRIVLVHIETERKFQRAMDRRTWRYAMHLNRLGYLAFGLSGSLAEDYLDRPQPLAAALAALNCSRSSGSFTSFYG